MILSRLLMLEQTLFSLPWLVAAALLPLLTGRGLEIYSLEKLSWGLLGFVAARSAGMALNRWIDRHIDALNVRTQNRPLQAGELTLLQVQLFAVGSLLIFHLSCYMLGAALFSLSFLASALLILYSFTKRFSQACHYVLGAVQFLLPVFVYVALTEHFDLPCLLLGLAQGLSIAGMDIVYALQDLEFDRKMGLFSVPACYGKSWAISIARATHFLAWLCLLALGYLVGAHGGYFVFCLLIAAVYSYRHFYAARQGSYDHEFFRVNVEVALLVLGAMLWAVIV